MSSEPDLSVGDLILVETPPDRYLAFVALAADQIVALPESTNRGAVVAGPASLDVREALRKRDTAALEHARLVVGSSVRIAEARWSADGGRLMLDVAVGEVDCATLAETLEPVFRAEVRCREIEERTSPA
ncbi:MAG TPA: hypothetical protein VKT80_16325 [Chloroflexota bacterium]|nr:hypothetical protein [Chloroflexota bacterium]